MRSAKSMLVLPLFLCASAAFAVEKVAVNVPFSFDSHGQVFPASQYEIKLSEDDQFLILSSLDTPGKRLSFVANPAGSTTSTPELSMRFEKAGNIHQLRSIRLGVYEAQISQR